jgi:hypothetical protein
VDVRVSDVRYEEGRAYPSGTVRFREDGDAVAFDEATPLVSHYVIEDGAWRAVLPDFMLEECVAGLASDSEDPVLRITVTSPEVGEAITDFVSVGLAYKLEKANRINIVTCIKGQEPVIRTSYKELGDAGDGSGSAWTPDTKGIVEGFAAYSFFDPNEPPPRRPGMESPVATPGAEADIEARDTIGECEIAR